MAAGNAGSAADPLQEHMNAVQRLARLIAGDDEQRFILVFESLANQVDGFLTRTGDEGIRHARSLLMRTAEPHLTRRRSAPRAAVGVGPTPPADGLLADPVFLKNARKLIRDRGRIVGGVPTSDFPDCVAVGSDDGWCCTGTLVAPNVVVTAGHCVDGGCASRVFVGEDAAIPNDGQVIRVQDAVAHPDYQPPSPTQDLAVLILSDAVDDVPPRAIADAEVLQAAATARLAGYGNTDVFSSGGYGRRRMVDVPIASTDPKYGADPATEFVAGAPFLDRDSCNGDSGGPAYVEVEDSWYLAGATSRATAGSLRPCGDGGIYTRVKAYEDWMRAVPGGTWG
jgi:hypothetical protein